MSNMQETIGGGIMMYIKITHQELESILLNKFHSEFVQRCKKLSWQHPRLTITVMATCQTHNI